jgi:hypothetical protein
VAAEFPTPVMREDWSGQLAPHSTVTLHIVTRGASDVFTADIPAEKVAGVPATVKAEEGKLSVAFDIAGHPATFDGKIGEGHNAFAGTFTQDGKSQPLTLSKHPVTN